RPEAVPARRQRVPKLMQEHRPENTEDERQGAGGGAHAAGHVVGDGDPRQEQEEGDVQANRNAAEATEINGPADRRHPPAQDPARLPLTYAGALTPLA